MSEREQLARILCSHPEDHEPRHTQQSSCWYRADAVISWLTQRDEKRDRERGDTTQKFLNLFSDFEDPCESFEQAEKIWNGMKRHQREREAALVEKFGSYVEQEAENCRIKGLWEAEKYYKGLAYRVRSFFHPDASHTLERIRIEARLDEAKWWLKVHGQCDEVTETCRWMHERIADLERQIAEKEKEGT